MAFVACSFAAFSQESLYKINDNVRREQMYKDEHRNNKLDKFALMDVPAVPIMTGYNMSLRKLNRVEFPVDNSKPIFKKGEYKYGIFLMHTSPMRE